MAFRDGFSIKLYDLHDLFLLVALVSFFFYLSSHDCTYYYPFFFFLFTLDAY